MPRAPSRRQRVLIEFSVPEAASLEHLRLVAARRRAGGDRHHGLLGRAARKRSSALARGAPIMLSPNMSVAVTLAFKLLPIMARALGDDYDVEITEIHHRFKKDAPSGTAVRMAEVVAEALGPRSRQEACTAAQGLPGERTRQEIGVMSLRSGDVVGEHTVSLRRRWASGSSSRTARTAATPSRAARCGRRAGSRGSRPGSTPWPTCWGSTEPHADRPLPAGAHDLLRRPRGGGGGRVLGHAVDARCRRGRRRHALRQVVLLSPVLPSKIVAVGLNYREHAAALGRAVPAEPLIFLKPLTAMIGPDDPIVCRRRPRAAGVRGRAGGGHQAALPQRAGRRARANTCSATPRSTT